MGEKLKKATRKALAAKRESKHVEFKERFDPTYLDNWCEIIKDIVSMANSGGGHILFGILKNGSPSKWDPSPVLSLDPAQITDRLASYTGDQFADFEITEASRNEHRIAVLQVFESSTPMVFTRPGTYPTGGGKQKTAFAKGTVYFRHGAKSEPCNSRDLRDCIARKVENIRRSWLSNIRKVVDAPTGYQVKVLPSEVVESSSPAATPIRLVDDPEAPAYRKVDPDRTHPYRQKDVVALLNQRLAEAKKITAYDVYCVRKVHGIDNRKPHLYYKSKFASPQYSDAFADWMAEQFRRDSRFFDLARSALRKSA